jgi:hypothetical protein
VKLPRRKGRELRLINALMPCASASAVGRGNCARCGKEPNTVGESIKGLFVQSIRLASWFCLVNWRVPFSVVRDGSLYSPVALTTFIELLGASAMRPWAGPLPLL